MKIYFLCVFAFISLIHCGKEAGRDGEDSLLEELANLSFVPGEEGQALLVDRYEVTNREFARFLRATDYRGEGPGFLLHWPTEKRKRIFPPGFEDHPVVFVSRLDAQAYAHWKGKRLPLEKEWERFSCGSSNPQIQYPWGRGWFPLYSNTVELGIAATTPVGTFESGKSIYGCYDVSGNVWEWVEAEGEGFELGVVKGGAFDFSKEMSRCRERLVFHEKQRAQDLGFRCVVKFESYLERRFAGLRPSAEEREGLKKIASRWGPGAAAALARLEGKRMIDSSLIQDLCRAAREQ